MLDPTEKIFSTDYPNPFGITGSTPAFADIDNDGDVDAFVGDDWGGNTLYDWGGNTLFFKNIGTVNQPSFAAAKTNPFGLTTVGSHASPSFADIDGDGDLDAFVGDWDGNILFFKNTGTVNQPAFAVAKTNPFGLTNVDSEASPTFADIDGDGDLDAFVGDRYGDTLFFENSGTQNQAAFAVVQTNPFGLINFSSYGCAPNFADIDGDSDLDAFVGGEYGGILFFKNSGNASQPSFASAKANSFGLTDVGIHAAPTFVDIDDDGNLDAFIGEYNGNTVFFENIGTQNQPAFAISQTNPFGLSNVGSYASPTFADIDGDDDLDAFVSDKIDTLFFENIGTQNQAAFAVVQTNPFGLTADVNVFADIDGDGDLDAFGDDGSDGNTWFFKNTGTANQPTFAAVQINPFGLTSVSSYAMQAFADIDSDDDLDAFVGDYDGNTVFFENTGTTNHPNFAAAYTNPFGLSDVGYSAKPTFADIDADHDPDIFIGNEGGKTIFFQNDTAISGTNKADNLAGINIADLITGFSGDDKINAKAGNDTLYGDAGVDTLLGGGGRDIYFVNQVDDEVKEFADKGIDTVQSTVDYLLPSWVENLSLISKTGTDGTGNEIANSLTGNDKPNLLKGLNGADTLAGNAGYDVLWGGLGKDTLWGGSGNDTEKGGAGADLLAGYKGNNRLDGGAGDDKLFCGAGENRLTGGEGADVFVLNYASNSSITDFSAADDTIELNQASFTQFTTAGTLDTNHFIVGTEALDTDDYLIYNRTDGKLYYDADANGVEPAVQIALIGANLDLTNADFVVV